MTDDISAPPSPSATPGNSDWAGQPGSSHWTTDGTRSLMIRGAGTLEYNVVYGFGTELRARVESGGK